MSLSNLFHFGEDKLRDSCSLVLLLLALIFDDRVGIVTHAGLNLEWQSFDVVLNSLIAKLAADETPGIINSVGWIPGYLVLGSITNKHLTVCKGDECGHLSSTLVFGDDLDIVVLPHSNAGVSGSQIDSYESHSIVYQT